MPVISQDHDDSPAVQFDTILSNPPFQKRDTRGRTPHKLWIEFTQAELGQWLKPDGLLYQISPASFRSPSNKILNLMRQWRTLSVRLDIADHFPQVGSSFAAYVIQRTPHTGEPTEFTNDVGATFPLALSEHVFYLPQDTNRVAMGIHEKVMFTPEAKLAVEHDYVTHHNSRVKENPPSLSRTRDTAHPHPVFHTNSQVWWSSILAPHATQRKVMWTRSGYTKPFYDDGTQGVTDIVDYVVVDSRTAGENLAHNLNTRLMHYIYRSAKWSGFGNDRVLKALPDLPRDVRLTDAQMYARFQLTPEEIAYVEAYPGGQVAPDRDTIPGRQYGSPQMWSKLRALADSHAYMQGVERTAERVASTGEVFTPSALAIELLASQPLEAFAPGRTVFDPACGDGQFLFLARHIKTYEFGMSEAAADAEIYGIDIMPDNIELARHRLGNINLAVGDALYPDRAVEGQTQVDRSFLAAWQLIQ